jgi:hypothetical protein
MRRTDIAPEIVGERRYAEHLREQLRDLGLDAELIGEPERPSLIAEARTPRANPATRRAAWPRSSTRWSKFSLPAACGVT